MKLARIDFKLDIREGQEFSYHKASLMQGVLMEWIDGIYADKLHSGKLNPYSQYLEKSNDEWHWIINLFNDEAYQEIYPQLIDKETIYLKHDHTEVQIKEKNTSILDSDTLMNQYYFQKAPRTIRIRFKTPTAFKQKGKYVFYPDLRCIFQSMIMKYDAVTVNEGRMDEEMLEELLSSTKILQYNLRSCSFQMEGIKIPAFLGEIRLGFHGPQTLTNYMHFLFRFATYCGIGIKASMGMGALEIQEKNK